MSALCYWNIMKNLIRILNGWFLFSLPWSISCIYFAFFCHVNVLTSHILHRINCWSVCSVLSVSFLFLSRSYCRLCLAYNSNILGYKCFFQTTFSGPRNEQLPFDWVSTPTKVLQPIKIITVDASDNLCLLTDKHVSCSVVAMSISAVIF